MGCDLSWPGLGPHTRQFQSTHPVWGATLVAAAAPLCTGVFQSTHPVWGATPAPPRLGLRFLNFNPRTPCGVRRLFFDCFHFSTPNFNPRTPCGVRRVYSCGIVRLIETFQSTHPVWGATQALICCRLRCIISIHAPRVGCDDRHLKVVLCPPLFQSTHPVWGATWPRKPP